MLDPSNFSSDIKPKVYIAKDDGEIEEVEFEAIAIEICRSGHLHGLIIGDAMAVIEAKDLLKDDMGLGDEVQEDWADADWEDSIPAEAQRLLELSSTDTFVSGSSEGGIDAESLARLHTVLDHPEASPELKVFVGDLLAVQTAFERGGMSGEQAAQFITAIVRASGHPLARREIAADLAEGIGCMTPEEAIDHVSGETEAMVTELAELQGAYQPVRDLNQVDINDPNSPVRQMLEQMDVHQLNDVMGAASQRIGPVISRHANEMTKRLEAYERGATGKRPILIQALKVHLDPAVVNEIRTKQEDFVLGYNTTGEAALAENNPGLIGDEVYKMLINEPELVDAALEELGIE